MKYFWHYTWDGDLLKWNFLKFATFCSFITKSSGHTDRLILVFPEKHTGSEQMMYHFAEVFDYIPEIEVYLDSETTIQNPYESYLRNLIASDEHMTYFDGSVAPMQHIQFPNDTVVFYKKMDQPDERMRTLYSPLGLFEDDYDASVLSIPSGLAADVLRDIEHIKSQYFFNDEVMWKLLPYIVQTSAILLDMPIQTVDESMVLSSTMENSYFLTDQCLPSDGLHAKS